MRAWIRELVSGWLLAWVLFFPVGSQAVVITYQAVDLSDTVVGEDLWQYRFGVSGSFVAFGGFNLIFSPVLYRGLENPAPLVNADWFVSVTEPDALLPADGLYSATALTAAPTLTDEFILSFVWLGNGTPGSVPFEVFDDTFSVTGTGGSQLPATSPGGQVPVPGSLALLGLGLLGLMARKAASLKIQ